MAARAQAHKTSFLILSDTHNFERAAADPATCPLAHEMPKVDVLLHCGDLTQVGGISAYKKALRLLASFDAELKLVIAGNHDISLDGAYWRTHLDEDDEPEEHDAAVAIMTGPLAKEAGVTYLTEGTHRFTLRDGTTFSIFASPYQPDCGDWAFGYPRSEDHFAGIPANLDIVMTHGPPAGYLDYIPDKAEGAGCASLAKAVQVARPKLHCFGHIHEGYGHLLQNWQPVGTDGSTGKIAAVVVAQAGKPESCGQNMSLRVGLDTLMVNAAVMDGCNQPVNAPWLVELDLA
ncbi:hypothetical protein LTR53_010429 [Teratosphaeriaceae sp. CCFEE 6253]|nr:hypothetical protein LTR53_010429 [Teratosphaeriaceae sp. CCFEE 6253]